MSARRDAENSCAADREHARVLRSGLHYDKCTAFRLAPKAIDVFDILPGPARRQPQHAMAFGGFKQNSFFLSQTMPDRAASDFFLGRQPARQPLHIIFGWLLHLRESYVCGMQMGLKKSPPDLHPVSTIGNPETG